MKILASLPARETFHLDANDDSHGPASKHRQGPTMTMRRMFRLEPQLRGRETSTTPRPSMSPASTTATGGTSSRSFSQIRPHLAAKPPQVAHFDPGLSMSVRARARQGPRLALLLVALTCSLLPVADAFFIDQHQSPHANDWSYKEQHRWASQYRVCSRRAQSPIDIQHKNVITSGQLKMHFYNYNRPIRFKLANAHHTIKLDPIGRAYQQQEFDGQHPQRAHNLNGSLDSSIHDIISADEFVDNTGGPAGTAAADQLGTGDGNNAHQASSSRLPDTQLQHDDGAGRRSSSSGRIPFSGAANDIETSNSVASAHENEEDQLPYGGAPAIKLDWLDDGNNEFRLRDIHFHWGEWRDNGSEHAIDGRRAAMEMHLVHIKHKLDKAKISFTSDSVAVIAILIESHRKSYSDFNPIVNYLSSINGTESPQEIDYKSIKDLLPNDLSSFYTYSGSLTTPPCYEVVNWIIMSETVNMNLKQIEMFRNLFSPAGHDENTESEGPKLMVPNIRALQPLNNRTIMASFPIMGAGRLNAYSGATSSYSYAIQSICASILIMWTLISTAELVSR